MGQDKGRRVGSRLGCPVGCVCGNCEQERRQRLGQLLDDDLRKIVGPARMSYAELEAEVDALQGNYEDLYFAVAGFREKFCGATLAEINAAGEKVRKWRRQSVIDRGAADEGRSLMIDHKERMAEIEAMEKAATKGPWSVKEGERHFMGACGEEGCFFDEWIFAPEFFDGNGNDHNAICESIHCPSDSVFIAHARDDIPYLITRVRDLEAEIRRLQSVIDQGR